MQPLYDLLSPLYALGFTIHVDHFQLTGLPQPFWVNADKTQILVESGWDDKIRVELCFEHEKTLEKYGMDTETTRSMMELCATEWFPDLEKRFARTAEYFGLNWHKIGEPDDVVPYMAYQLHGSFPPAEKNRILALLLEINSVFENQ